MELSERAIEALERLAASNERIVEMADEERQANHEGGPAYCPHCATMNPVVRAPAGEEHMELFVLGATCMNCQGVFYAVPDGWIIYRTIEEMEAGRQ